MALSVASSRSTCVRGAVRSHAAPARRHVVVVRAGGGLGDAFSGIASAFTTIFSPPTHNNVPRGGTGSSFSGRISHKPGKPFADGFGAGGKKRAADGIEQGDVLPAADDDVALAGNESANESYDYVSGAVTRVVGHHFKGDATEPEWAGTGWKGEIHSKKRDGFHTGTKH